ncbi:MAG: electron transfer flavoprotein-ubiquinone oxidoreductase [Planctomycetes bacterium]|nr:electron transfer flavoprotein-ubiquinone oxidoreductase [Planctomycetota bacterium]
MEFDVVIVGAGPAGLACAIHLQNLVEAHNEKSGASLAPEIVLLEKGREVGAHIFSGAVMDAKALDQLLPDWKDRGAPIEAEVTSDKSFFFTKTKARATPVPPPLKNHGYKVVSLNRLVRWLGEIAEEKGISVFPGFPGAELVYDDEQRVVGVQLQDAGVDKNGQPKGNYEAGANVLGKVTVLCEGSRGSLTKQLIRKKKLQGKNPQVYATGVKEVWEVPKGKVPAGLVEHNLGWPLPGHVFGGGWVYGMGEGPDGGQLVSIGYVAGLDTKDPTNDPHYYFNLYKTHPRIAAYLEGGKMLDYGAKSLPEGGVFAMPKMYGDGFLICGDSAGFLNGMRLKGIHLAIRSGMLAAETIFEGLVAAAAAEGNAADGPMPAATLANYTKKFESDWSRAELWKARNFHQGFHGGRFRGLWNAAWITLTGGKASFFRDNLAGKASHEFYEKRPAPHINKRDKPPMFGTITFDKVTDVYASGTTHEEDQPCHLVVTEPDVCMTRCKQEYGNPCQYFCPANVYEMVAPEEGKETRLQLSPSNCVHCKTCDIADPYQIIEWKTPEGGGGPGYRLL